MTRGGVSWEGECPTVAYLAPGVAGQSALMRELFRVVALAAGSPAPVLIEGESGTGKELVARALHELGHRRDAPFLAVSCGALPETLLESELFGHRAGSFTGAVRDKVGLLEAAQQGTLFLDEISEVSPGVQVKLLRALQQGEIMRLGEVAPRRITARIVAATNRSLRDRVAQGRFREDLFYRLHVIPLWVPPLRDRPEDIDHLVSHFLHGWQLRTGHPALRLAEPTLRCLAAYPWPGNIRELENEIERLLTLAGDRTEIPPELLSPRIRAGRRKTYDMQESLQRRLDELESELIQEALERMRGNKSRAAHHLGVSRQGLYKKMARLGLACAPADAGEAGRDGGTDGPPSEWWEPNGRPEEESVRQREPAVPHHHRSGSPWGNRSSGVENDRG